MKPREGIVVKDRQSSKKETNPMNCELCQRETEHYSYHHLIPKSRNGINSPRAVLCTACHRMVHKFFSNRELAQELNSINKLKSDVRMAKFINWVRKQKTGKKIKVA